MRMSLRRWKRLVRAADKRRFEKEVSRTVTRVREVQKLSAMSDEQFLEMMKESRRISCSVFGIPSTYFDISNNVPASSEELEQSSTKLLT